MPSMTKGEIDEYGVVIDDKPSMTKVKHDDMARTLDVGIKAIGTHWNTKWVQMTHYVVICGLMGS